MLIQRQHFLLSYLKTLNDIQDEVRTHDLLHDDYRALPTELMVVRYGDVRIMGLLLACIHLAFTLFSSSFNVTKFTIKLKTAVSFLLLA